MKLFLQDFLHVSSGATREFEEILKENRCRYNCHPLLLWISSSALGDEMTACVGKTLVSYRGHLGPSGPKSKKGSNMCSWSRSATRSEKSQTEGTKIQPKVFLTEVCGNPLGSWTSAPSGHGCPRPNACFFQGF